MALDPTELLAQMQSESIARLGLPMTTDRQRIEQAAMAEVTRRLIEIRRGSMTQDELAEYKSSLREALASLEQDDLPTEYERRPHYRLLRSAADDIEGAIREQGFDMPAPPLLGTLHTGTVNAVTVAVPGSKQVIVVFESGLFSFTLLLSKAVIAALSTSDGSLRTQLSPNQDDVVHRLRQEPDILSRFKQVLLAYAVLGTPSAAPPYALAEPWMTVAAQLAISMKRFVVGHEYGHILADHHGSPESAALPGGVEIEEHRYRWAQELEADSWGLRLMVQAQANDNSAGSMRVDFPYAYWGADFYFSCQQVLQRAVSILATGNEDDAALHSTHPPPEVRRQSLRKQLSSSFGAESAERAVELATAVDRVLWILWEQSKPLLYRRHHAGISPAPIWTRRR